MTGANTINFKLQTLINQYEATHPLSKNHFERAQKVLPAGSTRSVLVSRPFPLIVESADGTSFTTIDGVTFEDFVSDYSAAIYGHSHPVIRDAVQNALASGFSLGGITQKEAQLAEIVTERIPSIEKVRFCNSGTEANTFALATAMAYTKRKKILVFENGYHGGTLSFGSKHETNPMNLPHDFIFAKYNDIPTTKALLSNDLAAILVEPMQAAGGMHPASREFLAYLREVATATGAVLIFDEVVTSRLHYHGLQGYWGIIPDMTTLGKYIGGGFPFGAFGGSSQIMDLFDSPDPSVALHHSGTFNNNIFTMSAAVAASNLITEAELQRLNRMGDRFREQGIELIRASGFPSMELTGYGSAVGIHFSGPDAAVLGDCFYFFLLAKRISVGRRGFVSMNLIHTEASVDRLLGAVKGFLDDITGVTA
ncbi:acetylornithine aminotransferase [Penicillium taxi]|uniref:acetylornithine aminotransferase n=1 Tax=Penicillium taxi TaxID=168475 RepID=UPI002545A2C0|nr:acetylornithine aminotransferase [Penicillium taxi]KAJ5884945.1 acetylornithine aminotransferase [Penicillium taxi]